MDQAEFDALKATFPWTERRLMHPGVGCVVMVIDCNGNEVSILAMTQFLVMITNKLAKKQETTT